MIMAELRASTVSAALHRLGFNPVSKRSTFDGLTVSGKGRVRVSATWPDLDLCWEMIGEVADALEGAGWVVERREAPAPPGLHVTGKTEVKGTDMTKREFPAIGDVVTVPGEHADGITRVGIAEGVGEYSDLLGGHLLSLRSVRVPSVVWAETWDPDTMIVARVDMACDHEVTGGYVYTGDPAGSRSMGLALTKVNDLGEDGLWFTAHDPEGMEVEVTVPGLTGDLIARFMGHEVPVGDSRGLVRALMAGYLDRLVSGGHGGSEVLTHAVMLAYGWSQDRAGTWLAEELQEMLAARG